MNEANEYILETLHSCFLEKDIFMIIMKHNLPLWRLYKITKCRKLALFIGRIQYFQAEILRKRDSEPNNVYDQILEKCFDIIIGITKKYCLYNELSNIKVKNIRGFDFFNAIAYGNDSENYIAINTGVFFLSHTLVKSIGILLMKNIIANKLPLSFIFNDKHLLREFVKTSSAIICKNHSKAIVKMGYVIPDNNPLLIGIELFCIAHEYSHRVFKKINFNYKELAFEKYFSSDIIELINKNEEVAADAFSIIILKHYEFANDDLSLFLYSPQFLFKILSKYDEITLPPESNTHPSNIMRYDYVKKMINNDYIHFDNIIDNIWNNCNDKIKLKYNKYISYMSKNIPIWNEICSVIENEINKYSDKSINNDL